MILRLRIRPISLRTVLSPLSGLLALGRLGHGFAGRIGMRGVVLGFGSGGARSRGGRGGTLAGRRGLAAAVSRTGALRRRCLRISSLVRDGLVVLARIAVPLGRADDRGRAQAADGGGCLASEDGRGAVEDGGEHGVW